MTPAYGVASAAPVAAITTHMLALASRMRLA